MRFAYIAFDCMRQFARLPLECVQGAKAKNLAPSWCSEPSVWSQAVFSQLRLVKTHTVGWDGVETSVRGCGWVYPAETKTI